MPTKVDDKRVLAILSIVIISVSGFTGALLGFMNGIGNTGSIDEPEPTIEHPVEEISLSLRRFAEYVDYESPFVYNAPNYNLESNLSNVINLDDFANRVEWTEEIAEKIEESYFAAVPDTGYTQFSDLYLDNFEDQLPSFVTSDSVLHAYHVLYDCALRRIETAIFVNDIACLSRHMVAVSESQYNSTSDERWREAALKNMAFFSVSAKITNLNWTSPELVNQWVEETLTLIDSAEGFNNNWFMDQMEDFSQYIPRGHYTRSEDLKKYFKAMMWFGRIGFRLSPADTWCSEDENIEKGKTETAQAILIATGLPAISDVVFPIGDANDTWSRIYDTTSFFVGKSDDLGPHEYLEILVSLLGEDYSISTLEDERLLEAFIDLASSYRDPRILSGIVMDDQDAENVTKGLRFMGQRYVPDSYILGQLVYKYVGNASRPRLLPKGLDIMSVFGSVRAWDLLQDQTDFVNYTAQMNKLRNEFSNQSLDSWTQNLYWLWLYSFKTLLEEPNIGCPSFMLTPAWTDKQLLTSLGTWTELRHDTVLYVKQSYTYCYSSSPPPPPPGFVEPVPRLYARLASLCRMMLDGLGMRGLLDEELEKTFQVFLSLLLQLKTISEKELSASPLNGTEYALLERIGNTLNRIEGLDDEGGKAALAVDVHTDPNLRRVLQEATGNPMIVYVAVPNENGQPFIARGAMYSYYEFTRPMNERLTDEQWWQILDSGEEPAMPDWTDSFVVFSPEIGAQLVCAALKLNPTSAPSGIMTWNVWSIIALTGCIESELDLVHHKSRLPCIHSVSSQ